MKRRFLICFALLTVIVASLISAQGMPRLGNAASAAEQGEANDKIKELMQKRLVTVTEIHKLLLKGFMGGQVPFDRVLEARAAMLRAELDLAETKQDRIKVHVEMVKTAEEMVEIVNRLAKAQQATRVDVLKAEAQLLEARIGLERAKIAK
jgi:outer membrane protein TolC